MATNEDLMHAIQAIGTKLDEHITKETSVLDSAKVLIERHGDKEATSARIAFLNAWMEREQYRTALHRAIIEKTLIGAVWAVLIYLAITIRHDLVDYIRGAHEVLKDVVPPK